MTTNNLNLGNITEDNEPTDNDLFNEILTLSGPIMPYYPDLRRLLESLLPAGTRSLTATALVLSQLINLDNKDIHSDWIHRRDNELVAETKVTHAQLRRAKRLLKSTHLVTIEYHGMPRTTWYRVNYQRITPILDYGFNNITENINDDR